MSKVLLFPGQGSQRPQMIKDLYDNFKFVRETVELSSNILSLDVKKILFNLSSDQLKATINAQVGITVASIASFLSLRHVCNIELSTLDALTEKNKLIENTDYPKKLSISLIAGHSLGEYAALYVSQAISLDTCIKLVYARAQIMQNISIQQPGCMVACFGITLGVLSDIIDMYNAHSYEKCYISSCNGNTQYVLSGSIKALKEIRQHLQILKARVYLINVDGAFHSPLSQSASSEFANIVNKATIQVPKYKIISSVDGEIYKNALHIKNNLIKQIYTPVRWDKVIQYIVRRSDINETIECEPSGFLNRMLKYEKIDVKCKNIYNYII